MQKLRYEYLQSPSNLRSTNIPLVVVDGSQSPLCKPLDSGMPTGKPTGAPTRKADFLLSQIRCIKCNRLRRCSYCCVHLCGLLPRLCRH